MTDSPAVRDELADQLRIDLIGPWEGVEEEFLQSDGGNPRDRYAVGLLAPRDAESHAEADTDADDFAVAGEDEEEDEDPAPAPARSQMFPSSFGLTFVVDATTDMVRVSASWAAYVRVKSQIEMTETGKAATVWKRVPRSAGFDLDLTIPESTKVPLPDDAPGVLVRSVSRDRGTHRVVTLFLVNDQISGDGGNKESSWLFQPELAVTARDGVSPVFLAKSDLEPQDAHAQDEDEAAALRMLYRDSPEFAVGHGIAVHSERSTEEPQRAVRLTTDPLPHYDVPQTVPPRKSDVEGFQDIVLDMDLLAKASQQELALWLSPLFSAYRTWLNKQEKRLGAPGERLGQHKEAAQRNLKTARAAADRIEAGVRLLTAKGNDGQDAWRAFRFANRAMQMQRQRTEATRLLAERQGLSLEEALAEVDVADLRSWRPFQLAFVLLNLPSLTDPAHDERSGGGDAVVDLLFFPTGGGKTEAYLGLTAYTFAIRRLQGVVDGRDGSAGVAVLMRYTLRLLTAQQFTRAAALVCACEVLRRDRLGADLPDLGDEPFRIGLWVGGSVTPNRWGDAEQAVEDAGSTSGRRPSGVSSPMPIRSCPWCGSEMDLAKHVTADKGRQRTVMYCGDPRGRCEFTERKNPNEGLPILTVDEEMYRHPPSLLIGTVDKLAALPWSGAAGNLFGHVSRLCPRHGYRSPDLDEAIDCRDSHAAASRYGLPAVKTVDVTPLRPPDLIIQDELHLISGALGTMVGLYETAVDELCSWQIGGKRTRSKVVASTATVRRADRQAHALFHRRLSVFPPPVLDIEDSFFAKQLPVSEENPGRRYLGVCTPGLRLKAAEIRVASAVLLLAQKMLDDHGNAADPYMTLVAYFSALRELGGMRRLLEDDITARIQFPRKGLERRRSLMKEELTSRVPSGRIPDTLRKLEVPFDAAHDSNEGRRRWAEDQKARRGGTKRKPEQQREMPLDVLLATNMFAVGVDVQRLGLMLVTGQPKATAEYIQATSRVGRNPKRPGLVVVLYNWARPRDLSHFETFEHYHETFYAQVEALSVTPFSPRALDRGLTGVFMGALRHSDPELVPNRAAHGVEKDDPRIEEVMRRIVERACGVTSEARVGDEIERLIAERVDEWQRTKRQAEGSIIAYARKAKQPVTALLRQPGVEAWGTWTAPYSMRETEPTVNLQLEPDDPSLRDAPRWTWAPEPGNGGDA
jgi:hypothetical protein